MARETKVGLLAGLAFIICFAIILANRGGRSPVTVELPYLADGPVNTMAAPSREYAASGRRQEAGRGVRQTRGGPARPSAARRTDRSNPVRFDQTRAGGSPIPVSGAQVPALDRTMRSAESFAVHTSAVPPVQEPATLAQRTTATGDAATLEAITKPAGSPSLTSPSKEWSQRQHSLQEHLDALSAGSSTQKGSRRNVRGAGSPVNAAAGEDGSAARAPAPKSTPATAAQRAPRYTVRSGDTLTRIASAHYGSRSKSVIDAIFDANRSVLADRDSLRVNVELVLPAIPGAGAGSSKQRTLADAPARSTMRPAGKPSERFRWYQINKNDRYISIARAQLGDGGRWREIYELNKDKFPDPGRIREGVRIKLPLASAHRRRP